MLETHQENDSAGLYTVPNSQLMMVERLLFFHRWALEPLCKISGMKALQKKLRISCRTWHVGIHERAVDALQHIHLI